LALASVTASLNWPVLSKFLSLSSRVPVAFLLSRHRRAATMSIGKMFKMTRLGTRAALTGGAVYLYYQAGLWKDSEETIRNYEKLKKDAQQLYDSAPSDLKKWTEYAVDESKTMAKSISKPVSEFRKEWLNFDLSFITQRGGDGALKSTWNKGVIWTFDTIRETPSTLRAWGNSAWHMITEDRSAKAHPDKPSPPQPPSSMSKD